MLPVIRSMKGEVTHQILILASPGLYQHLPYLLGLRSSVSSPFNKLDALKGLTLCVSFFA